ncbi:hypothetical protein DACRYDRAFT_58865 [Dacryopinax primogenitus]|uniref:DUF7719 domain-containing protein n=1 Tax=Dacryopinax primogenitus (strain DJM 731) TaxID=1858805 RepID=M5FW60_DACPD|nr:uncharacterized protein DACRYDRAFT_58865 [Dacryopinax primogenitus]EJT97611.1 hypothetical protein DACRYDRAFT_58865 [Dacryopinax primogenitus]
MSSNTRRKRKSGRTSAKSSTIEEIPEDEQWRLVQESGILKQVPQIPQGTGTKTLPDPQPTENDEIFQVFVYLIPFSSLYALMDILVHQQYRQAITFSGEVSKLIEAVPILAVFIFYSMSSSLKDLQAKRHKTRRWVQGVLTLLTCASGMRLFWVVNKGTWKAVMRQAAPLSTVWIYGIVQLHLIPAVISLCVIGAFVKMKNLKITL